MPVDSFEELLENLTEDTYLAGLEAETREALIEQLNVRIDRRVNPHDLFGLVLVMLDLRPACIVGSQRRAVTLEKARALAAEPVQATRWDPLGQFLDVYDIPFELLATYSRSHSGEVALVHLNYHVSFDEDHLTAFAEANTESIAPVGLSREDDELLGEFLGYPEAAIEAYCDRDHHESGADEGHLVETIPESELIEALGGRTGIYDRLELDYRAFTRCLLPYVVPSSAPECLDRIVSDVARSIAGGMAAEEVYGCTVFEQVIADYRARLGPDAASHREE